MPGNIITINSAMEYYVGDSKMEELMAWLKENGFSRKRARERKDLPSFEDVRGILKEKE